VNLISTAAMSRVTETLQTEGYLDITPLSKNSPVGFLEAIYPFMHEASALLTIGFLLIVAIYIQVAILFGVYTPELFPTEVRLRANGIHAIAAV
jgi:hypothetical protein